MPYQSLSTVEEIENRLIVIDYCTTPHRLRYVKQTEVNDWLEIRKKMNEGG